ncbi:glycoside hydrolase family 65 protein [candidate division FCPU426 bacterium]|nr:glycoside hydrolase family 65 protein [candidate division FCPU426 bacterium]
MRQALIPTRSGQEWLVEEKDWNPEKESLQESLFTLGNGYLGSRGILEEIPSGCTPGTYFAGLYDDKNTQVTELVNAPNPVVFKASVGGQPVSCKDMTVLSHFRVLDMRQGVLIRRTVLRDKRKRRILWESARFYHLARKHCAVVRVCVTPLDGLMDFGIETYVDDQVTNKGIMTEGDKMHQVRQEKRRIGQVNYLACRTFEQKYLLSYAALLTVHTGKKTMVETREAFSFRAGKGQTVCFTKYIAMHSTRDQKTTEKNIVRMSLAEVKHAARRGFDMLFEEHCRAWQDRWEAADIILGCGGEPQRALRYNIYHLCMLSNPDDDHASIGARTLSAEDYKGHVFWDTEIFMLPFYIYTQPETAKALLLYRYHCLDAARRIAASRGYAGAQFPWESADKGVEVTPRFTMDLDGRIVPTIIGQEEHIVADVGYATWHYYQATGDKTFMLQYGLELVLETARFWVSRVKYDARLRGYVISGVMGCDEFHGHTANNAFTNGMARFNIQAALQIFRALETMQPGRAGAVLQKIGLTKRAMGRWEGVARLIKPPAKRKDRIIEEFDGFFKLKLYPLPKRGKYGLPGLPSRHVSVRDMSRTQYVKQGDTLLLLYLLSFAFDMATKKANYAFYEGRTLHKSSLSPSTHAIIGAETGDLAKAYKYFLACLYTDIHNLYNNTGRGIHGASLGATWQVVVNGFAGMRISDDGLSFHPRIPRSIGTVSFVIRWRQAPLRVCAQARRISLLYDAPARLQAAVAVGDTKVLLQGGEQIVLEKGRSEAWRIKE